MSSTTPNGRYKFEPIGQVYREFAIREGLSIANHEWATPLHDPDYEQRFPIRNAFADPTPEGQPRVLVTLPPMGVTVRFTVAAEAQVNPWTLLRQDGTYQPLVPNDIVKVEYLRDRKVHHPVLAAETGPFPYTRWITPPQYREAMELVRTIREQGAPDGVELGTDPAWPMWLFLRLLWPGHRTLDLVLCVPTAETPWGTAETTGFGYCVKAETSARSRREKLPTTSVDLSQVLQNGSKHCRNTTPELL